MRTILSLNELIFYPSSFLYYNAHKPVYQLLSNVFISILFLPYVYYHFSIRIFTQHKTYIINSEILILKFFIGFLVSHILFYSTIPKLNFQKNKSYTQTLSGMAFIASSCFSYMIFFIRSLYAAKMSSQNIQSNLHCLSSGRRNLPISITPFTTFLSILNLIYSLLFYPVQILW